MRMMVVSFKNIGKYSLISWHYSGTTHQSYLRYHFQSYFHSYYYQVSLAYYNNTKASADPVRSGTIKIWHSSNNIRRSDKVSRTSV